MIFLPDPEIPAHMCQALRQSRTPEQRRMKLTVSILLLLTWALIVPGCASLGLNGRLLSGAHSLPDESSAIRSQNSADLNESEQHASKVAADYSSLKAGESSFDSDADFRTSTRGVIPVFSSGHAFVQRRAKLGKPIPLPDRAESPVNGHAESVAGHSDLRSFDPKSEHDTADRLLSEKQTGPGFGTAGWQPIPDPSVESLGATNIDRVRQSKSSLLGDGWTAEPLLGPEDRSVSAADVIGAQQEKPVDALIRSVDASLPDTATPPNTIADNETIEATADQGLTIAKEPTVLDRLRGLYIPRRDEAALDRSRKANRRWTDPFGLMRDREPDTGDIAVGATSPVQVSADPTLSTTDKQGSNTDVVDSETLLEPLIAIVEQELEQWPRMQNGKPQNETGWRLRQTDLRVLYMIAGRSAESIRFIESLPEKEQEFWQSMMLAMETYRGKSNPGARAEQLTETLEYVRTASRQLQPLSTMRIRRMNFCDRIDGFGDFSSFPGSDFNAGQPLMLYTEIENYKAELTTDGHYRSEFTAMIEFFREDETEPIASRTIRLPEIEDLCSTERTDYFQSYELTVPSLSPGRYTLRLRVRDQLSLQTATSDLSFDIRPLGNSQ
ncbi:MAG: hypothetical protein O2856_03740 [Planctomycetota bacterium]|nr:hypothetical protein [Planctomycetota bacterium]